MKTAQPTRVALTLLRDARRGRFRRTMALAALFGAVVSGFEADIQHLRGAFRDWLMWTPVVLTPPMALAALAALASDRAARLFLPALSAISMAEGAVGFVLHLRGINRLPGGLKLGLYNITMGPPIFAPLLFVMVGFMGLVASAARPERWPPAGWRSR